MGKGTPGSQYQGKEDETRKRSVNEHQAKINSVNYWKGGIGHQTTSGHQPSTTSWTHQQYSYNHQKNSHNSQPINLYSGKFQEPEKEVVEELEIADPQTTSTPWTFPEVEINSKPSEQLDINDQIEGPMKKITINKIVNQEKISWSSTPPPLQPFDDSPFTTTAVFTTEEEFHFDPQPIIEKEVIDVSDMDIFSQEFGVWDTNEKEYYTSDVDEGKEYVVRKDVKKSGGNEEVITIIRKLFCSIIIRCVYIKVGTVSTVKRIKDFQYLQLYRV